MGSESFEAGSVKAFVSPNADIAYCLGIAEALLAGGETYRSELSVHIWQPRECAVVLGRASRAVREIRGAACENRGITIYRRITGGGTVLLWPSSWCYSFVFHRVPAAVKIQDMFSRVHGILIDVLYRLGLEARSFPVSDLAVPKACGGPLKIAGHGQKRTRGGILCEGVILSGPPPFELEEVLSQPPREPPYRKGRSHRDFLTSLCSEGVSGTFSAFASLLVEVLGKCGPSQMPEEISLKARQLALTRYRDPEWTGRL